jgi:uroporphyrinogen decarboxylase
MQQMTSLERMTNTLARRPVDHIPAVVSPWGDTIKRWTAEGHIAKGEDLIEHFNQDLRRAGWLDSVVDLDFEEVVLEETHDTILKLDGNGAKLRRHKLHAGTPEHVGFTVTDREGWEAHARDQLVKVDRRRVPFEAYRKERALAAEQQRYFCWEGVGPFEQMHPLCGHEHMLIGMAADPDWVIDMVQVYIDLTINHLELLFAEEGAPDCIFVFEDMGFRDRPFMSPLMYQQIIEPGHKRLFDFAHAKGCSVILHSCGHVEPLVPGLIRAGIDCLQAMEVKAGMDMPRLAERFGDRIAFYGNIDARILISNDLAALDVEMRTKIPAVLERGGGYILHSDHSEPPDVNYETICFFLQRGREIGSGR